MQARVKQPTAAMIEKDPDDTAFAPTPQELERLLFAVESSLQVNKRFQFFLWAQGVLQTFLPHAKLICAYGDLDGGHYTVDVFSSDNVASPQSESVDASVEAFVEHALAHWDAHGRTPLLLSSEVQALTPDEPVVQAVWEAGLGHVIAHGTADIQGPNASFFVFGRLPKAPRRRAADVLEIMLPHLHLAVFRCARDETKTRAAAAPKGPTLSFREVQIMRGVRDGLTNSDIGLQLDISPLTVKNHVQRILRKLGVANRIQAVTRCLSMGVFENKQYGDGLKMLMAGILTAFGLMLSEGAGAQSLDDPPAFGAPGPVRIAPMKSKPPLVESFQRVQEVSSSLPLTDPLVNTLNLIQTMQSGDLKAIQAVLDAGVDVNRADLDGTTPLGLAVLQGRVDLVRVLLARGADPSRTGWQRHRPLSLAIMANHQELIDRLLKAGAKTELEDGTGYTPLGLAAYYGRIGALRQLQAAGADVNFVARRGPALLVAAANGQARAVQTLLALKANPNETDATGKSALFYATSLQNRAMGKALLAAGAEPGAIYVGWLED